MRAVLGIFPTGHEPIELCSADPHRLITRSAEELQEIREEMAQVRRFLLRQSNKATQTAALRPKIPAYRTERFGTG